MTPLQTFMHRHFQHFNSGEVLRASASWVQHVEDGGQMLVSLAGAMSTAGIGRSLAPLIREGAVHAISCTGANLEEDAFLLLARNEYERIADWRALRATDEMALLERGMNRVTDTCIPETVMRHLEQRLLEQWQQAGDEDTSPTPAEHLMAVLTQPELAPLFQGDPEDSWLLAAAQAGIPVFVPGWEDSTTGNMFAAAVLRGAVPHHGCVAPGTAQMERLLSWYLRECGDGIGFFQVGGGIAGDFAICAVPTLTQDLRQPVPTWAWFCQISDAVTSYGGYSGAVPNEKITWGKLGVETPKFMIESDATIVAPLIFSYVADGLRATSADSPTKP